MNLGVISVSENEPITKKDTAQKKTKTEKRGRQ